MFFGREYALHRLKELLGKQLNIDPASIDDDADILEDLGADSLEVVEMLMTIEDKFGIRRATGF